MKKITLFFVIIFNLYYHSSSAHILHYKDLNKIIFDIYRNSQFVGQHTYKFNRKGDELIVENIIDFQVKKFGVSFYEYFSEGIEVYILGKLKSFSSKTNHNKKKKFTKIYIKNNEYFIEGSSYKGEAPKDFIIGTWWNHSIVKSKTQISPSSGRLIKQNVKFLGKETLEINKKIYSALKFNFSSSDPSLSEGKKLDTNIWYDEKTLIWLKASFKKSGKWEYRLKEIK